MSITDSYISQSGANIWSLQGLTAGQHTLQITPTAGQFSLDYITYTPTSPATSSSNSLNIIVDDADNSVQLSGNWTKSAPAIQNGVPYQGTISGSSTVGDTMKVQFVGMLQSWYLCTFVVDLGELSDELHRILCISVWTITTNIWKAFCYILRRRWTVEHVFALWCGW